MDSARGDSGAFDPDPDPHPINAMIPITANGNNFFIDYPFLYHT
jgi:hypothetical protein